MNPKVLLSFFLLVFNLMLFQVTAQTYEIVLGDTINYTDANGLRQGFWREYWSDEDLKYEVYYIDGIKDGLELRYYNHQDCLEQSINYRKGIVDGPLTTFYPDCSKKCEEYYRDGVKNGYERCYNQKGWLETEGYFKDGELEDSYVHFDKTGSVKYESSTKDFTLSFDKFITGEYKLRDSTVLKVLNRNDNWNEMLVVCDVTGSMFPFMGQILIWFKVNYELYKIDHFVLFNDGDKTEDASKVVGRTGGVYMYEAKDFRKLKKSAEEVIKEGTGGDSPENDLEAVYKAINAHRRHTGPIVLIADNNSPVRDMQLLRRIRKPIKVVLCGTSDGINPDYLKIAHKTKGSVHTIESDIVDIGNIKEGQTLDVDGNIFVYRRGNFEFVRYKYQGEKK